MDILPGQDDPMRHRPSKDIRPLKNLRIHTKNILSTSPINTNPARASSLPRSSQPSPLPEEGNDSDPDFDDELDFGLGEGFDAMPMTMPPPSSIKFNPSYSSFRPIASPSPTPSEPDRPKAPKGSSFMLALMQASHAECEPGTTSDLLSIILDKNNVSNQNIVDYAQITHPVKIWWGREDDRISERSMRWLERCMNDVELKAVENEGHGLLSSVRVMWEVFESLGGEARKWGRVSGQEIFGNDNVP